MLLENVRVVSLCHYLQGPAAAQYLADMGADVIKVEPIGGAYERKWSGARIFIGEVSSFYLCANRNKRSISVDLKSGQGREIFLRLVSEADVVMENFRPGTLDRLGLGEDVLRQVKPDLIFASASGYGPDGPYSSLPGQDLLIQARTGLVSATAGQRPDVLPAAAGCAVVDQHGAALFALGITAALFKKLRTGEGTRVESNLFNAGIDLQQEAIATYINGQKTPEVLNRNPHLATWFHEAPYGIYETCDGKHLALSLNALDLLEHALGMPSSEVEAKDADEQEEPIDAYLERDKIALRVARAFSKLTHEQAMEALAAYNLWHAPVANYSDLADDPQATHNEIFAPLDVNGKWAVLVNHPNRYDGKVPPLRHMAFQAGQHTSEVLSEHGYDAHKISEFVRSKIVA